MRSPGPFKKSEQQTSLGYINSAMVLESLRAMFAGNHTGIIGNYPIRHPGWCLGESGLETTHPKMITVEVYLVSFALESNVGKCFHPNQGGKPEISVLEDCRYCMQRVFVTSNVK